MFCGGRMLRKLIGLVVILALPSVVYAQTGASFIKNDAGATLCGSDSVPCAAAVDADGRILVNTFSSVGSDVAMGADAADRTTAASAQYIAAAAGTRNYVSAWGCVNTGASASRVSLRCGSTDRAYGFLVATNGQFSQSFDTPVRCATNEAVNINIETATTATRCHVIGGQSPN
jgi:hypothetical protein